MSELRRALVLAPLYDTPGRKDASGAFQPEARKFVALNQLAATVALFDSNRALADRRYESARHLSRQTDLDVVALFCHGWKDGVQAGWTTKNVGDLGDLLALACKPSAVVALYCCDTGRDADTDRKDDAQAGPGGQGGFADLLVDRLRSRGWAGRLFGHTTAGHTSTNPNVRIWGEWGSSYGWADGEWLVEPGAPIWKRWRKAMQGDLRLTFPFQTIAQITSGL